MVNGEYLRLSDTDDTYCADIAAPWLPSVWNGRECLCRIACRQSDKAPVIVYVDGGKLLGTQPLPAGRPTA